MKAIIKPLLISFIIIQFLPFTGSSQALHNVVIANTFGLTADQILLSDSSSVVMAKSRPLYSFRMNGKLFNSSMVNAEKEREKSIHSYLRTDWALLFRCQIQLQEDGTEK
ncbi:MAG: hypothetical protein IPN67_15140 [Bacteroidales bacterium]|nr:hypothetical protein [Bacteroidales bacterium]